jgi:hypothetical protein
MLRILLYDGGGFWFCTRRLSIELLDGNDVACADATPNDQLATSRHLYRSTTCMLRG